MTVTTNYYNRSVDLSVFQGIKSSGMATVDQALFTNGGEVCTGIQKLIQRWLIAFLTPEGTVKFHPEWGTEFLAEAGNFKNEVEAETEFYLCNSDACDQLREEEDDNMSDDERIDSVELKSVIVSSTGFSLSVKINSLAGESSPLVLPITINPLQL